jgi:hypothetical protein
MADEHDAKKPPLVVHYPTAKLPKIPGLTFIACGVSRLRTGRLVGFLIGNRGTVVLGTTLRAPPESAHWRISFCLCEKPPDEEFVFHVAQESSKGTVHKKVGPLTIRTSAPKIDRGAVIHHPSAGAKLCNTGFIAVGELIKAESISQCFLSKNVGTTTEAISAEFWVVDPETLFWSALFPDIPDGTTWKLNVIPSDGNPATADALEFASAHC